MMIKKLTKRKYQYSLRRARPLKSAYWLITLPYQSNMFMRNNR